jgi:hypothetical protein
MTTGLAEELARAAQDGDTKLGTQQLEARQAWRATRQPAGCCCRTDLHDAGVAIEHELTLAVGAIVAEDSSEHATELVIVELADEGDSATKARDHDSDVGGRASQGAGNQGGGACTGRRARGGDLSWARPYEVSPRQQSWRTRREMGAELEQGEAPSLRGVRS